MVDINVNSVCVIGVGYVGDHLVDTFKKEYDVIGVDLSQKRVNVLKEKYKRYNNIHLQSNYNDLGRCNVFLISVPTLVKNGDVDMLYLENVKTTIEPIVKAGSLIVVESSVYVGATREIFGNFRKRGIYVGFSPERVDPGRVEPKMEDIPKVIAGIDKESLEAITRVYSRVIKSIVPVSSIECAEMCKLYENCFRMVNIAYVNEIADMCKQHNIDSYEMISASATKPFGFMPFYPGIGVGGHCIPVNPYYLFKNGNLPVLQFATNLMNARPKRKAYEIVNRYPTARNVLVCGIGFKRGEALLTNSPGYSLYKELKLQDLNMFVFDPIAEMNSSNTGEDITFINTNNLQLALGEMDLVIVIHNYAQQAISNYEEHGGKVEWFVHTTN